MRPSRPPQRFATEIEVPDRLFCGSVLARFPVRFLLGFGSVSAHNETPKRTGRSAPSRCARRRSARSRCPVRRSQLQGGLDQERRYPGALGAAIDFLARDPAETGHRGVGAKRRLLLGDGKHRADVGETGLEPQGVERGVDVRSPSPGDRRRPPAAAWRCGRAPPRDAPLRPVAPSRSRRGRGWQQRASRSVPVLITRRPGSFYRCAASRAPPHSRAICRAPRDEDRQRVRTG
jgi:hypothetical protein